jgi:hypothetical protein
MSRHPSEYFTFPGKILALLTLVIAVGGPFAYFDWIMDDIRPGTYPLWLFAMPVVLLALAFFGIGVALLRWLGIKVFKDLDAS